MRSELILFRPAEQVYRIFPAYDPDDQGWRQFHRVFEKGARIVNLSRVAFDSGRQYALVHMSSGMGSVAGGGDLYLLKRNGERWLVARHWTSWTT